MPRHLSSKHCCQQRELSCIVYNADSLAVVVGVPLVGGVVFTPRRVVAKVCGTRVIGHCIQFIVGTCNKRSKVTVGRKGVSTGAIQYTSGVWLAGVLGDVQGVGDGDRSVELGATTVG